MKLQHRLHAVIYPAEDLPGQWIALCLELDIATQGNSAEHAIEMLDDALRVVAHERMNAGLPPFEFRSAPPEDWERFRNAEPDVTHILRIDGDPYSDEVTVAPYVARAS
ncbi:MAG: hypothetical protein V2A73_13520 [Pseudomonadota bacterium]